MRAQRVVAATAAVGLVAICCVASISAGSASMGGSSERVKAAPDPGVSQTTTTGKQRESNPTGSGVEASRAKSGKAERATSLRKREVFKVSVQSTQDWETLLGDLGASRRPP
ncbi:MAG TPA: hypothetical protein VJ625_07805 [Propionibacteriaceae bacterium]|nr:hypothetical protein [Propionibacteriaceae bacterium]